MQLTEPYVIAIDQPDSIYVCEKQASPATISDVQIKPPKGADRDRFGVDHFRRLWRNIAAPFRSRIPPKSPKAGPVFHTDKVRQMHLPIAPEWVVGRDDAWDEEVSDEDKFVLYSAIYVTAIPQFSLDGPGENETMFDMHGTDFGVYIPTLWALWTPKAVAFYASATNIQLRRFARRCQPELFRALSDENPGDAVTLVFQTVRLNEFRLAFLLEQKKRMQRLVIEQTQLRNME